LKKEGYKVIFLKEGGASFHISKSVKVTLEDGRLQGHISVGKRSFFPYFKVSEGDTWKRKVTRSYF